MKRERIKNRNQVLSGLKNSFKRGVLKTSLLLAIFTSAFLGVKHFKKPFKPHKKIKQVNVVKTNKDTIKLFFSLLASYFYLGYGIKAFKDRKSYRILEKDIGKNEQSEIDTTVLINTFYSACDVKYDKKKKIYFIKIGSLEFEMPEEVVKSLKEIKDEYEIEKLSKFYFSLLMLYDEEEKAKTIFSYFFKVQKKLKKAIEEEVKKLSEETKEHYVVNVGVREFYAFYFPFRLEIKVIDKKEDIYLETSLDFSVFDGEKPGILIHDIQTKYLDTLVKQRMKKRIPYDELDEKIKEKFPRKLIKKITNLILYHTKPENKEVKVYMQSPKQNPYFYRPHYLPDKEREIDYKEGGYQTIYGKFGKNKETVVLRMIGPSIKDKEGRIVAIATTLSKEKIPVRVKEIDYEKLEKEIKNRKVRKSRP